MGDRDFSKEPVFAMGSIQSDLLLSHAKNAEAHIFFKILRADKFKHFLRSMPFTSGAAVYRPEGKKLAVATGELPPNPRYGAAFTFEGLKELQVQAIDTLASEPDTKPFVEGLTKRAVAELNDADPKKWVVGKPGEELHGVFIITGADKADVKAGIERHFDHPLLHGFHVLETQFGNTRPGKCNGHEHFGFLDGVSQPGIRGCVDPGQEVPLTASEGTDPDQGKPGQDLLWPGEFVFGYPGQKVGSSLEEKGEVAQPPLPFMVNGAYLVVRRLQQFVPEMHAGVKQEADRLKLAPELVEAQIVGRWPSGAPILLAPDGDDPVLGGDELENNKFEFGDDRLGLVCPWAAHIRKAYPRDDVPGNVTPDESTGEVDSAEAFTQTHRMLRRGIQFGPELTDAESKAGRTLEERGLLFKCYVTNIADQFEFVQKVWVDSPNFAQPKAGIDAIIGQVPGGDVRVLLGAAAKGSTDPSTKPTFTFKPWVQMTGGGYFFAPSIDFLRNIR
jgi:Dyp-type peroxidase family